MAGVGKSGALGGGMITGEGGTGIGGACFLPLVLVISTSCGISTAPSTTTGAGISVSSSSDSSSAFSEGLGIGDLPVKISSEARASRTVAPAILGGKSTSPWNMRNSPVPTTRAVQLIIRVSDATLSPAPERRG